MRHASSPGSRPQEAVSVNGYDIRNAIRYAHGFPRESSIDDLEIFDYSAGLSRLRRILVALTTVVKGWV
jgi:hypothetical protein